MEKIFVIKGTNLTIHMPKELDHHNAEEIKREADRLLGTRNIRSIIFDFEKTSFMDSSGIGLIMGRHRSMESIGGEVIVRNPPQHIRRVMRLSGMERIARIQMDAPAAQPEEPAERRDEQ